MNKAERVASWKSIYEEVVTDYVKEFCGENYSLDFWVRDVVGIVALISSEPIDFLDMKYCVDNDIPAAKYMEYSEWACGEYHKKDFIPDFISWLTGQKGKNDDPRNWNRNARIVERMVRERVREVLASQVSESPAESVSFDLVNNEINEVSGGEK